MLKKITLLLLVSVSAIMFSGCGPLDAFRPSEETSNNDVVVAQNALSIIYVPTTGASGTPPSYGELENANLPPSSVEAKIVTYPTHGNLIFSSNMAIYKPAAGYTGVDYYAFEVFSAYDDEITTYKVNITVVEGTPLPFLAGSPSGSAKVGVNYSFTPTIVNKSTLPYYFSVEGSPSWMTINTVNGHVSGVPQEDDVGVVDGISIIASDGATKLSLTPFSIKVSADGKEEEAKNTPPTISGIPSTEAYDGVLYTFTPVAHDNDGDALFFRIANQPLWSKFSTKTGTLSGKPSASDVGKTSTNISIYVSDGKVTTTLAEFSIKVN